MGKKQIMRKKQHNPLGRYNWVVPSDTHKFWHISLDKKSNTDVWSCRYGWLLISEAKDVKIKGGRTISYRFSIWEPEFSEVIKLPSLQPKEPILLATLLSAPTEPGCCVMLVERNSPYILYYKLGDKEWSKSPSKIATNINPSFTHCQGKLFAATLSKDLMEIGEKGKGFRTLNCMFPKYDAYRNYFRRILLDFCGQLCFLELGGINEEKISDISIFKLDAGGNGMEWVNINNFENQAIFVSGLYAFSCSVNELPGFQEGFIYLFQNKRFYSINIRDKSISSSLPLEKLSKLENSPFLSMQDIARLFNSHVNQTNPIGKLEAEQGGRIVIEHNNGARTHNICNLHDDILGLIVRKLYPVEYVNFRSVCNDFLRVAPRKTQWSRANSSSGFPSMFPWLVFPSSCATHLNFINGPDQFSGTCNIPEGILLDGNRLRYSKGSWLLICNLSSRSMFFYHPFRNDLIKLPTYGYGHTFIDLCSGYALSASPTSGDSILVGHHFGYIYYFHQRRRYWSEYLMDGDDFIFNHISCPIYFDGAFYFLSMTGRIGVFALNDNVEEGDDQVSWKVLKELCSPCDNCNYNYLLECDGNLLSVFVVDQLVHIYKLNRGPTVMAWEKVTNLGNHALFVSHSNSFSAKVPHSLDMENKVYFPKLYGSNIFYYCLRTEKFYTCGNKEVVVDFYNTKEFLFSAWIEPSWDE